MKTNNFDLLRLLLAFLVVNAHLNLLGINFNYGPIGELFSGIFAVQCFFVVSGFLIFQSWENSSNIKEYLVKRIRRIYPAYAFVVCCCAFLLVFVSAVPAAEYFMSGAFFKYLVSNLLFLNFLQSTLPGVFEGAAHKSALVNGPLWTIKIEMMFYLSIPVVAWFARFIPRVILFAGIYVLAVAWNSGFSYLAAETGNGGYATIARQLPGQMSFFIAGGALYYYFDYFRERAFSLFAIAVAILVIHFMVGLTLLFPVALAIAVIYLATSAPYCGNFGRFGDFSYGVYIYHYPIIQTVAALGLGEVSPLFAAVVALYFTLLVSYASWHLIERPALSKSSHYVVASRGKAKRRTIPSTRRQQPYNPADNRSVGRMVK